MDKKKKKTSLFLPVRNILEVGNNSEERERGREGETAVLVIHQIRVRG